MSRTPQYVIRGGAKGRERLRMLARVMWPTTQALLERVGVAPDARCLDLGCGGGDVTVALARMAPQGLVVGIDLDETGVQIARDEAREAGLGNVEFRIADVTDPPTEPATYDLVYARFVLTHLADPAAALDSVREWLAPGGAVVVEDIDFAGHFCYPPSEAFDTYVEWYTAAARAQGADPTIGPRVPSLVRDAGFVDCRMHLAQPAGFTGEVKLMAPSTLEAIADTVLAQELATEDEIRQTVDELYAIARDELTVQSVPRIVQVWGRRAGS